MGTSAHAVRRALSVGIFPYVFKLLGSPAAVRARVCVCVCVHGKVWVGVWVWVFENS